MVAQPLDNAECFADLSLKINRDLVEEASRRLTVAIAQSGAPPHLLAHGLAALAARLMAEAKERGLVGSEEMVLGFLKVAGVAFRRG